MNASGSAFIFFTGERERERFRFFGKERERERVREIIECANALYATFVVRGWPAAVVLVALVALSAQKEAASATHHKNSDSKQLYCLAWFEPRISKYLFL